MPADPDRLVELGLTTYEAKVYLALLRRDVSTAADVTRLAGIPRQRRVETARVRHGRQQSIAAARQPPQHRAHQPEMTGRAAGNHGGTAGTLTRAIT